VSGGLDSGRAQSTDAALGTDREAFDPQLRASSTVHYEPRGARLEDWGLFNSRGDRVNHLVRGRRYSYRYLAVFESQRRTSVSA